MESHTVRLTQYSHGAGCGCKISPGVLTEILKHHGPVHRDPHLLIGYDKRDDAAVYSINDKQSIISTTDFFMPIVDDPFDFGAIASVNAISDVYAMGGVPLLAISVLAWPVDKLEPSIAARVLEGARDACARAAIPLAGGHSIDAPEPIFGLAVTGIVDTARIRSNDLARTGDELYLTKPLGVGILTTAQKRGVVRDEDFRRVRDVMLELNDIGAELSSIESVRSMTDVTGFGLLGHLIEMCEASGVSAKIVADRVPRLDGLERYADLGTIPGGTARNFDSYSMKVSSMTPGERTLLCDPQTSGGLLVAVDPNGREEFLRVTQQRGMKLSSFGKMVPKEDITVTLISS